MIILQYRGQKAGDMERGERGLFSLDLRRRIRMADTSQINFRMDFQKKLSEY